MKKLVTGALAALTLGGAVAAGAVPTTAAAQPWHGGGYWHGGWGYRGWGPGAAVGAGLLGFAVGATLASPHYYYAPPPAYYVGPAYYGYYGGCRSHWRWDPYAGRYVRVGACW